MAMKQKTKIIWLTAAAILAALMIVCGAYLGAYSTANLSDAELDVLSIYGSEDMVMNREKYEEYRGNLPGDFAEIVLEGGCHAGFGMYGPRSGDGTPTMTTEEQIMRTAAAIAELAKRDKMA